MRESRTSGSVRGAPSNGCPYRDPYSEPKLTVAFDKAGEKRVIESFVERG